MHIKKSKSFLLKRSMQGLSALAFTVIPAFNAYAGSGSGTPDINTNYTINSSGISSMNPEGLIIGLAVWICRLVGIGMLIWGIYGYVTARKDGEAESMNGALGKLISGLVLVCMPSILSALQIINV